MCLEQRISIQLFKAKNFNCSLSQASPKVAVEQQDEKKLIGFAQLSVIHDK